MGCSVNYKIQRVPINTTDWTPVDLPFFCQGISMRCDTDNVFMRTNTDDPTSQDTLPMGAQEYVLGPAYIWGAEKVWIYVKAQTHDNAVLIVKFVRFQGAVQG